MRARPYGQGIDSTLRVRGDREFCRLIHGVPVDDCHLEGWPTRAACEIQLMGGCPVWQFRRPDGVMGPCFQVVADPGLSCDHFGDPVTRDDPQTPAFEGEPKACGLQRDFDGNPKAGFFTIAHGRGGVRACLPTYEACSPWVEVDH